MSQTRDSSVSVSPGSRSPRSHSPLSTTGANGIRSKPLPSIPSSPLQLEQRTDGETNGHVVAARESPRPYTSGSIKFANGPTGEFPFHAANGTLGQSPTNDLFVKPKESANSQQTQSQGQTLDQQSSTNTDEPALSRKRTNQSDAATPTGRRSVQFARSESSHFGQSRQQSWETEDGDNRGRQGSSLMSKLKALASPMQSHGRAPSGFTGGDSVIDENVPTTTESEPVARSETSSEADADGEESADEERAEGSTIRPKRRRKGRRIHSTGLNTAPTTPKNPRLPSFFRDRDRESPVATPTTTSTFRPNFLSRRATMTDIPEDRRVGLSEDEGRDRLAKQSTWRRGNGWVQQQARGMSYSLGKQRQQDGEDSPDNRRPSNFRRITGIGQAANGEPSPLAWRRHGDRASSVSAAKWKELKAGIRAMGRKKKEQMLVDHQKSAELMAELLAGAPAALFAASMFQSDEHGRKRLPVLLEQLKVRIVDSQRIESRTGDRHMLFKIELEYGSGLTRMKWVIHRTLRDFTNLHVKYKLQTQQEKYIYRKGDDPSRARMPRFPRSAFPYLRQARGLADEDEEEGEECGTGGETSDPHGDASGTDRPNKGKRRRSSFNPIRRKSSIGTINGVTGEIAARAGGVGAVGSGHRREPYQERQRKKLETYLQQMIRFLIFRADSNRLCRFLELSALGIRLASEGGYHGKEGLLVLQSSKGVDFRRALKPGFVKERHRPMWFLVRHSYVVCVDSPEGMNIYDVFLVDPDFTTESKKKRLRDQNPQELAKSANPTSKHHQLRLHNSERKLKLLARNERQLQQFKESIKFMVGLTEWSKSHRFDSFAPIRYNVFARWLVDGRDYMWNVSRAISMARDVVYIHDWWLSPELYMRRPAAISQKWRLDRLLQRKAQEGVKIYIIVYRNINSAIPIDSEYTKFSLLDLHANIFVQRSPNQFRQNTFFWAHHEKICIVDHSVAFCGGVDLCFGRWDSPEHSLVDDKLTGFELNEAPKDADHCQLWPGKDYSNPRVQDFYALDKPYEEMYDRTKVPRMPWHDIAMQIVGQPARDLTRHFVQRWNYILRQRKPSRPTPFLLPPPDFIPEDIQALGLDGTCEVQILRSCSTWSIGTPDRTEHSIMNAYVKLIEESEHFIYVENQFFISSCNVEGTVIQNTIGDAIVERIKRAYANDEDWRMIIVIPLMPGFQNTVDAQDGTSVRLIMQCQYRSISRGDTSIFARLRDAGIEPEDYIQFYSLRQWGKIGPRKVLITEQLYIHAKCMIVDDRVVIIGSANINERSMLGTRDSEVAAVVRDTDMIPSVMAGEEYAVGRFPHTLRMRLMREHLGIDVDALEEEERTNEEWDRDTEPTIDPNSSGPASPATVHETERKLMDSTHRVQDDLIARSENLYSFNHLNDPDQVTSPDTEEQKKLDENVLTPKSIDHQRDVRGEGPDNMRELGNQLHLDGGRDSAFVGGDREILVNDIATEGKGNLRSPGSENQKQRDPRNPTAAQSKSRGQSKSLGLSDLSYFDPISIALPPPHLTRLDTQALGLTQLSQLPALPVTDDTDIGGPPLTKRFSNAGASIVNPLISTMRRPLVDSDCMRDPLSPSFSIDIWHAVAENNTKLYRQVFRCMPDSEARDWRAYKEFTAYNERFMQAQGLHKSSGRKTTEASTRSGPPGTGTRIESIPGLSALQTVGEKAELMAEKVMEELGGGNRNGDAGGSEKKDDSNALDGTKLSSVDDWAAEQAQRHLSSSTTLDEKAAAANDDAAAADANERDSTTLNGSSPSATRDFAAPADAPANLDRPRASTLHAADAQQQQRRRRRGTTRSSARAFAATDELLGKDEAEALLRMVQGTLVCWPYDWLEKEERGGNWLYNIDQIAPMEIYD